MKRKLQYYGLFMLMISLMMIANSCNATLSEAPTPTDTSRVDGTQAPYPVTDPSDAYPPMDDAYPPANEPVTDKTPVTQIPADQRIGLEERVYVDSMDIFIQESFPVQVSVQVYGNLPDGCTTVKLTTAEFDGKDTFEVHIYTLTPKDVMCTQALVPFEENIPLDVEGLPAGTYTVKVYDLENTFTLDVDNEPSS